MEEVQRNEQDATKKDIIKVDISYERIDDDMDKVATDKRNNDITQLLGKMFNVLEIGRNAKKIIDPNLEYAVKFPAELLKKMEEHDVRFLTDKLTGDLLPDLYDYTDKGIGGKIRLEIKGKPTSQDLLNLNNAVNNLIEQNRYDALVQQIQQIHAVAMRIERGQDNDRFAKVNAGRKMLLDATRIQNNDVLKEKMILEAVAMLREGRELIEITLLDKLNSLEMVPKNVFRRLWTCAKKPEYFEKQTGKHQDIQEYFQYYYLSIEPMAYAYTYLGQSHLVESLLYDSRKVFEHDKIKCLSSIELLLPDKEFGDMWYKNPKKHENKLIESYMNYPCKDDLYVTVKGCDLLEVSNNGREK
ncbi:MAG: hypothetical protein PHX08_11635 [Lachnospiraceae bacterium]|nr:hypothetical protein [Lachnospiraceae bacterium]